MRVVGTFGEVRELSVGTVGLVPTMGFLHEGHLSLIEAAAKDNDTIVVSLFVNPLQFNEAGDLDRYPSDLDRDRSMAEAAGADILFAPDVSYMYGADPRTSIGIAGVADAMEGAHRPGHFDGVATVVAKLFAGTQPDASYFGRKDAQQLAVVRTMAGDLSFPTRIVGMPIVREADGLALSSRNVQLDTDARVRAVALSSAMFDVADAFDSGERGAGRLIDIATSRLSTAQDIEVEYVEVARAVDASVASSVESLSFLAVAAIVGGVRLIDNVHLDPMAGVADRGIRLTEPSTLYGGR